MSSGIETKSAVLISEINTNRLFRDMKDNVSLEGPTRIGYYSCYVDDKKEKGFSSDKSSLAYLNLPNLLTSVSIDCLQGYDKKTKYGHHHPGDMHILRWVLNNKTTMQKFPSDFIGYNALIKDMMNAKYFDRDWNIYATKIDGKIILNRKETIGMKERIDTQSKIDNQSSYVANNLQRLITKNSNHSSKRSKDYFFGVFHSKIGSHRILHAGHLDCVESEEELTKPFDDMKLVLIKKLNAPRRSHSSFQAYNWWSLARLATVDTIVRVKCDLDFTIKKIDKLDRQSLIHKDRQIMFFASLNTVLDHVKSIVTEENKCYKFLFNAKNKKLTSYMMLDLDESVFPSWYIDQQIPLEC